MESASPAAVHSARFEEMSTPPADAYVLDCIFFWYDSPETVVASVESTSHASFAGAVPVVEAAVRAHPSNTNLQKWGSRLLTKLKAR